MAETVADLQREIAGMRRRIERLEAQLETQTAGGSSRVLTLGTMFDDGTDRAPINLVIGERTSDGQVIAVSGHLD